MVNKVVNAYARVKGDTLVEHGIKDGQLIYLAGNVLVPLAEGSFDYRMKFLGALVFDDHITVDDDTKMFYIDPDNFEMIDEDENNRLCEIRDADFKPKDEEQESA